MKNVLLIGYPFPLRQGGSPRLLGLAKYLPQFGWQPTILTAPLDQKSEKYDIIETGYRSALGFWLGLFRLNAEKDLRSQVRDRFGVTGKQSALDRLLTFGGEIVNYPDSEKGWKPFAVKAGDRVFNEKHIDAIISTSAPLTVHTIAHELKRRHSDIPWVADLRDRWSQNHNYTYSRIRRWLDKRLELKTLSTADAITTVSQPWADDLGTLHEKRVSTITNGFDPEETNEPPAKVTAKFTISYTGLVYTGKQDPSKLFAGLQQLIAEERMNPNDVEVRFYGPGVGWLPEEIEKYGLSVLVKVYDRIPREAVVQKQRESHILLLLDWDDQGEKGVYPVKVFEYLAARRPILATGGSAGNVVAELLKETHAGIQAMTVQDTKTALGRWYSEYQVSGKVPYHGEEAKINKYSHLEMARRFSDILGQIVRAPDQQDTKRRP